MINNIIFSATRNNELLDLAITSYYKSLEQLNIPFESSRSPLRFLGKRRGSMLFIYDHRTPVAPNGVLIKYAIGKQRVSNWNPNEEAYRLSLLEKSGPKGLEVKYLNAIAANENPPYLILPYFPSSTLRSISQDICLSRQPEDRLSLILPSVELVGRWLGKLYKQSPRSSFPSKSDATSHIQNLVSDLRRYTDLRNISWFKANEEKLLRSYNKIQNSHPSFFHGDFNLDNILLGKNGKIAIIDPEPLVNRPYGDFCFFLECLVVYLRRGRSRNIDLVRNSVADTFCKGIESELSNPNILAEAFLLLVLEKLAWYHKNRKNRKLRFTPGDLLYRYDQWRLMTYWMSWVSNIPNDFNRLWDYLRADY